MSLIDAVFVVAHNSGDSPLRLEERQRWIIAVGGRTRVDNLGMQPDVHVGLRGRLVRLTPSRDLRR